MKAVLFVVVVVTLFSCGDKGKYNSPTPDVNKNNCTDENIKKIQSPEQRDEFYSLCFKSGDWNKKSPERKW